MKLVLGGCAQGKLTYVLSRHHLPEEAVYDSILPDIRMPQKTTVIINHFHNWVRKRMQSNACPEEEILSFLAHWKDCIIITDEIGNGIVPADPFERAYRERTGRILIQLAGQAEEVERVICGIGQKIK